MNKTTAFTRLAAAAMLAAGAAAFTTGCTTTGLYDNANQKVQQESLQAQVNEALSRLYRAAPGSEALEMFRRSNGWTIGIDATAAIGHLGANGMVDSRTSEQPVTSFVLTNVGLEAGVSVQGAKVSRAR